MSTSRCCVFATSLLLLVATVAAQQMPKNQLPVWNSQPDIIAFEKMENDRLAAAQRWVDQLVAAKGPRTIENTLAPYDQAFEQINAAVNIANLIQKVHSDAAVSRSQYGFDSQSVRPYFPHNEVKQGIMNTAAILFHVTFHQELNVPAWDASVETWDVIDNGKAIGPVLSRHASQAREVRPLRLVPCVGRNPRQTTAGRGSGMQLTPADRDGSRINGL